MNKEQLAQELRYALPTSKILYRVTTAAVKVGDEYIVLKEREGAQFNPTECVLFNDNRGWEDDYVDILHGSKIIFGDNMINSRGHQAIEEYLDALNAEKVHVETDVLWIGLVRVLDTRAMGMWSSGSNSRNYGQAGFTTKFAAEEYVESVLEKYEKLNADRTEYEKYKVSSCVICYDKNDKESVEGFFKYFS